MTVLRPFNEGWRFRRLSAAGDGAWETVELPHSPFVADLNASNHWLGECEYHCLVAQPLREDECAALWIGAAMHTARVFLDGSEVCCHRGGYLPFELDLTAPLRARGECSVLLRLDNRDDPDVPPGKPLNELDFCWFGGLYRGAELRIRPAVHITDAVAANEVAGGGVFVRTLEASSARALLSVKTHLRNTTSDPVSVRVRVEVRFGGTQVANHVSDRFVVAGGSAHHVSQQVSIFQPRLWSPASPALHDVVTTVMDHSGAELDRHQERIGIRTIAFSRSAGFRINGGRVRLRGTNRHQEMPRVGYAAPRAAQVRDAVRIKEAGFDYVRLSHYPQSSDFLDACDELGLVVMAAIPGWQYLGGPAFREACFAQARELIRRDRNHACVVLWELSLNETAMDDGFMAELHRIGHEEYPGDQLFTCGWMDAFDVFIHSRQHGQIHTWVNGDKALVIAEYGDWEFYASNQGFDQKTGAGVFDRWSTARQFRADGERGLRQQMVNHLLALNDTLSSPAVLDGQWAMFDYSRGYDPVRASVGVMDSFRLPKFSYHFYRSQRASAEGAPMVFIASHWTPTSDLRIHVLSNCDEVELRLNGKPFRRQRPARSAFTQHLPHPPFVFDLPAFTPGTLEAVGFIDGQRRTAHSVSTPGPRTAVEVRVDDLGVAPRREESDVLLVHAAIIDGAGTSCIHDSSEIVFSVIGAEVVGPTSMAAEAGIASIVVFVPGRSLGFEVHARFASEPDLRDHLARWTRPTHSLPEDVSIDVPATAN